MFYGTCFLCGRTGPLEEHHVFNGPLRQKSDQYGLVIGLCGESCHRNGKKAVHRCGETAQAIKRHFQIKFMQEHDYSVRDFIMEWGRNYLDDDYYTDEGSHEMNSVAFSGRLTADPVLRYTKNNKAVCSFKVAVARPGVSNVTDFIRCVAWEWEAEFLCKHFKKGKWIEVSGIITSRDVTDQQGNKRSELEVVAKGLFFGGAKKDEDAPPPLTQPEQNQTAYAQNGTNPPQYPPPITNFPRGGFSELPDGDGDGELPF